MRGKPAQPRLQSSIEESEQHFWRRFSSSVALQSSIGNLNVTVKPLAFPAQLQSSIESELIGEKRKKEAVRLQSSIEESEQALADHLMKAETVTIVQRGI